jgi:hypothetical protein
MSQSLTQFAQEVGRSRDTVTKAIATLGLTVPKPPPGKPTQIPPAVQASLKTHFGVYPQVQPEPQPKTQNQIDPTLMAALERIYKTNIQAYKALNTQVSALEVQTGDLKEELAELTQRMEELRTAIAPTPPILHQPTLPKRPTVLAPMAIAAALLMAIAVWFFQQSPQLPTDHLSDPARAELYQ